MAKTTKIEYAKASGRDSVANPKKIPAKQKMQGVNESRARMVQ